MTTSTMPYFWTMYQLEQYHSSLGYHFFSVNNRSGFDSRVQTIPPYKGRVFVTSERRSDRYPRRYSVRYIDTDGIIITVGGFQAFESRHNAHAFAKAYAQENFGRVANESVLLAKE